MSKSCDKVEGRKKSFLFVDDSNDFLSAAQEVFADLSKGTWRIHTALNHAEALNILSRERLDVVVLDVDMPVMDGVQFLQLLGRTHPGQQVVILTGHGSEEVRRRCFEHGAALFFEKLLTPEGFQAVYAALDALAAAPQGTGFQGMMRRVGLQEVLQIECLGRKSSVLEIFAPRARGRIFICDGSIIHAETGRLSGELALYGLLALQGGGFNLLPYEEPGARTIDGPWEFLLMEAARLADEGAVPSVEQDPRPQIESSQPAVEPTKAAPPFCVEKGSSTNTEQTTRGQSNGPALSEVLLCSGGGEVLHAWNCEGIDSRRQLLAKIDKQAREMSALAPIGRFAQLILIEDQSRAVCQIRFDRRLYVRACTPGL